MGCVYQVTNRKDENKYIGKTIQSLDDRKREHKKHAKNGSDNVFHRALRKHGKENFEWEVLFESNDNDILCKVEIDFIGD